MAVETGLEAEKNIVHSQGVEKGLVSVIIPVFNTELYLTQCMESILGQTYQNIEIIAVDNASTDGSLRILREYAQKDDRVRIVAKKINASAGRSRNIGLDAASGGFIWVVDSDDYAEKNFLEVTVAKLQEYKDINIVQTCYWTFDDFGTDRDTLPYHETMMYTGRELCIFMSVFVGLCGPNVMLWNKLYRREVFDKYGYYDERLTRNQDNEMNYRIRKNGGKIFLANDIRFVYYCRDTVKGIVGMALKNGAWNIVTMKLCPGSMGLRHFIPFIFVLSLIILPIFSYYFLFFAHLLA